MEHATAGLVVGAAGLSMEQQQQQQRQRTCKPSWSWAEFSYWLETNVGGNIRPLPTLTARPSKSGKASPWNAEELGAWALARGADATPAACKEFQYPRSAQWAALPGSRPTSGNPSAISGPEGGRRRCKVFPSRGCRARLLELGQHSNAMLTLGSSRTERTLKLMTVEAAHLLP